MLKTAESDFPTILDAGGAVKANFLPKLGLEIFLCSFLASPGLLVSRFFCYCYRILKILRGKLHSKFLASLDQSETLFQPLLLKRGKAYLIDSLKGSVHGQLALLLLGLQRGDYGHSRVIKH